MKDKITKEELLEQNAKLRATVEQWKESDEAIRKNFAREFGWFKRESYSSSDTPETPPWSKIYVHLGKILANQTFADNHTQLHQIEYRLVELEKENQKQNEN